MVIKIAFPGDKNGNVADNENDWANRSPEEGRFTPKTPNNPNIMEQNADK